MINIYKQPKSASIYANLFIQEIPDNVENVCLLFIGHLETIYDILVTKPSVNFTVIDGKDTTDALPYIYNGANLKERITFEESDCEDETFLEKLETCFENYIMNNMSSFDLIIANPPYGKSSSLSKKIVNKMLESKIAEEIIYLSPTNTYKSDVLRNVQKVQRVDWGIFEDADIYDLCVTVLSEKTGPFVDYASFVLNEKLLKLHRFTQDYNKTHSSNFKVETRDILDCKKDWSKTFAFSYAINNGGTTDATPWEDSIDLTCFSNKRNGPTGDIKFNFGKDFESFYKRLNGDVSCLRLIDMHSEKERTNFSHWYYKASPLVNAIRSTISQCENITPRAQCYIDYFPQVDWSHPWTDQEILAEIGLPEDFLEKE